MMIRITRFIPKILLSTVLFLLSFVSWSQVLSSTNTVKYKITYNATTQTYTAWVVPDYSVPNSYNAGTTEKGGTAQFSIVVPKDFVITEITDIKGTWTKPTDTGFTKFGPGNAGQTWTGLDASLNYYIIGKTTSETDYGAFTTGTPVALFSFKGNGCFGPIKPLPANDPFIAAADVAYSLNVANSFYSRSGQTSGGNVIPLEQFINITGVAANCSIIAIADDTTTYAGQNVKIPILTNDKTGDSTSATLTNTVAPSITTSPTHGTVNVNTDGTITYTPTTGYKGTDTFIYTICDLANPTVCDTALVTISISCPVVTAPTLSATTKSNVCPTPTADLSGLVTSSCPTNYALEWHNVSSGFNTSNKITDITAVPAGTYYAVCYDTTNICYGTTSSAVTVSINACVIDTDGDGVSDAQELLSSTDPNNFCSFNILDQLLQPSTAWNSADCDNDGITNGAEKTAGSNPLDACSPGITTSPIVSGATNYTGTATYVATSINTSSLTADGGVFTVTYSKSSQVTGTNPTTVGATYPATFTQTFKLTDVIPTDAIATPKPNFVYNISVQDGDSTGGLLQKRLSLSIDPPAVTTLSKNINWNNTALTGGYSDAIDSTLKAIFNTTIYGAIGVGPLTTPTYVANSSSTTTLNGNFVTSLQYGLASGIQSSLPSFFTYSGGNTWNHYNSGSSAAGDPINTFKKAWSFDGTIQPSISHNPYQASSSEIIYAVKNSPYVATGFGITNGIEPYNQTIQFNKSVLTLTNTCPDTTVDLTALVSGSIPAGSVVKWFTNDTHTGTEYATPAKATANSYYAFYYNSTTGCYSPASAEIRVSIVLCCVAGNTAPSITPSTAKNICPATTVDLALLPNTGTVPQKTTLVWSLHNTPTSTADTLTNLVVGTSGKYYAFYFDKAFNCYSPADSVDVTISICVTPDTVVITPNCPTCPVTVCTVGDDLNTLTGAISYTTCPTPTGYTKSGPDANGCFIYTPNGSVTTNVTTCQIACRDGICDTTYITVNKPLALCVLPKVYLQGALLGVVLPDTLMRDDLRVKGLIPTTSPYPAMGMAGLTSANNTTLAVVGASSPSGANAIVDWVFVELRSGSDSTVIVDSRSALVQRDGDIVDTDGVSPMVFGIAQTGNYYVVVRHRNHLGVMSVKTALSTNCSVIDFRKATTPTFNLNASSPINQAEVVVEQGRALWAGNALPNNTSDNTKHEIIYQGTDNDVNIIYQQVINASGNIFISQSYKLKGYYSGDINMNGEVIFQGTGNDVEFVYQNIIKNHPGNLLLQPYFKIKEQIP